MDRERLVLTSAAQREADRLAVAEGAPTEVLVESAGESAAEIVLAEAAPRRALVLAGRGGNGGDALVVARRLLERGVDVFALALCGRKELSSATAVMARRLEEAAPGRLSFLGEDLCPLEKLLAESDCVIDGLFGSGLDRPLAGPCAAAVGLVNAAGRRTISLDLPSGLPSDRGELLGLAVEADLTVAMEFLKPSHLLYPARAFCGEVVVARVAYPEEVLARVHPLARVLTREGARNLLPARSPTGHKGTFGRVLVVAGSVGMSGAAILCARGALRAGAGLVTVASPAAVQPVVATALPEAITIPLPDREGRVARGAVEVLAPALDQANALAIGPGLGRHEAAAELVAALLERTKVPLVLDADALFALTSHQDWLKDAAGRAVLTPHPGEMARLVGRSADAVDRDRIAVARDFAKEHNVVLLLKGRPTAIGRPDGEVYLNDTGSTGLAKGASGDVLTGIIAGLLAGGAAPADAAVLGAYLHGYAADLLARSASERSLLPSDVVDALPSALFEVER
jgi:NAD(P)H-hydrate epimerase